MYNPQENPMAKTVVELKDVSVFQRKNLILHDINLTIERGEFVYLIGKTGSGKSSLLKIDRKSVV